MIIIKLSLVQHKLKVRGGITERVWLLVLLFIRCFREELQH